MRTFFYSVMLMGLSLPALADNAIPAQLEQTLTQVFDARPDSITPMPVSGIYEVSFGGQIVYVSGDGQYLFNGELFSLATRTNLTEQSRGQARLKLMEQVPANELITYKAKGKEKHVITVFTDIDCGYCRRLHGGMAEMNNLGITVRYMAFPRSPAGSASFNKSVSVWCASDRNKAMDDAKLKERVSSALCDNAPVASHQQLGQQMGVTGTPAILLSNGTLIPGYLPPAQLLEAIEERL